MEWKRPLPKRIPCRIHADFGHPNTSWSGELRAVVDGEWLVIRIWSTGRKVWRYFVEWRYQWEKNVINPGPLPRPKASPDPRPGDVVWTDYPIAAMGDKPGASAPTRRGVVLSYDGDKYCQVRVDGCAEPVEIKAGYLALSPPERAEPADVPGR